MKKRQATCTMLDLQTDKLTLIIIELASLVDFLDCTDELVDVNLAKRRLCCITETRPAYFANEHACWHMQGPILALACSSSNELKHLA